MKNEFIPYDLALELKQLGFDEPCFAWYNPKGTLLSDLTIGHEETDFFYTQNDMDENQCIAPTYSQAFRWFRNKFNCHHTINLNKKYVGIAYSSVVNFSVDEFNTYEEAELACLKKLIETIR
jgi:hypothetical protein